MQTRNTCLDLYCALVPAMLLGRVVGGAAKALFYLASAKPYSLALWASGYLISTLPGILLHLLTVPALVLLLMRAQLLPPRYPAAARQGAEA